MTVAVVIAARDEAGTVGATVTDVLKALAEIGPGSLVLVVDDGSTDGTAEQAENAGATVLRRTGRGQGAALRDGYAEALAAGATVVVSMDADGQHLASDLAALVTPVLTGAVDVATGSRVLGRAEGTVAVRAAGIKLYSAVLSGLARRRVTDPSCGYRALSAQALQGLRLAAPQFHTAEVLGQCYGSGLRVREVPVTIVPRAEGVSHKPMTLAYGLGFGETLVRAFATGRKLRQRKGQ